MIRKTILLLVFTGLVNVFARTRDTVPVKESRPNLVIKNPNTKNSVIKSKGGGAGGPNAGFIYLDMSPMKELVMREDSIRSKAIDFSNNAIFMYGGMGYGGPSGGVRFGGGGWFGMKTYVSDEFPGTLTAADSASYPDSTVPDSVVNLRVMLAYGGFTVEKGISIKSLNLFAGGLFGGGALIVQMFNDQADSSSAFKYNDTSYDDKDGTDNIHGKVAVLPFIACDLRAGLTYSILPFMHLGADGYGLFIYSSSGFANGYNSVSTISPGFRIRIMFGSLG
jgi:hypothetical protein